MTTKKRRKEFLFLCFRTNSQKPLNFKIFDLNRRRSTWNYIHFHKKSEIKKSAVLSFSFQSLILKTRQYKVCSKSLTSNDIFWRNNCNCKGSFNSWYWIFDPLRIKVKISRFSILCVKWVSKKGRKHKRKLTLQSHAALICREYFASEWEMQSFWFWFANSKLFCRSILHYICWHLKMQNICTMVYYTSKEPQNKLSFVCQMQHCANILL